VAAAVAVSGDRRRDRVQDVAWRRRLFAGRPLVRAGQPGGVDPLQHRGANATHAADRAALAAAVVEPAFPVERPLRIDRQTLDQGLAGGGGLLLQAFEVRPGGLGVDEVRSDRRDAAPVVDAGRYELGQDAGAQIRRRLDMHAGSEHEAGRGDRPQQVLECRLGRVGHPGLGLGPEVLDDDFLDVAVLVVQVPHREQGVDPFLAGLADADQDPRGEGHPCLTGQPERLQPAVRHLVGAAVVGLALLVQPHGHALQHDAHRRRYGAQTLDVPGCHQARVEVGQEPGLAKHPFRGLAEVGEGRLVAELGQALAGRLVAQLRLVPEGEERLFAAGLGGQARLAQDRVQRHVRRLALLRRLGEDAVVTDVPAQVSQRQEDLARVRDEVAVAPVTQFTGDIDQLVEAGAWLDAGKRTRFVGGRATVQERAELMRHGYDGGKERANGG